MMRKPPYTECKIYYDGVASIEIAHFLKTPGGSAYRVQSIRQDRKRDYRVHLTCLRWPVAEIPADAKVHALHWYTRTKKRGTSLQALSARAA